MIIKNKIVILKNKIREHKITNRQLKFKIDELSNVVKEKDLKIDKLYNTIANFDYKIDNLLNEMYCIKNQCNKLTYCNPELNKLKKRF